jgi:hypothetical protein
MVLGMDSEDKLGGAKISERVNLWVYDKLLFVTSRKRGKKSSKIKLRSEWNKYDGSVIKLKYFYNWGKIILVGVINFINLSIIIL